MEVVFRFAKRVIESLLATQNSQCRNEVIYLCKMFPSATTFSVVDPFIFAFFVINETIFTRAYNLSL